ncbi:pilus assembly PilX N-terminal domain-containing protein [Candidatus Daviesbacteria bacterium]|nr:pilus assembly PilX N-terminal domain-containing protein [Candidatus Daviesbacteria bacterium]
MSKKGQLILTLILVMSVALAVGLSIIQKSLVDISTSTKVEQSSRAFSAAEAGIEKALQVGTTSVEFENKSKADVVDSNLIPCVPGSSSTCPPGQQAPLEFPPLSKEEIAQVWLADYNSPTNPPAYHYKQTSLDVYWGNSDVDRAALELTLVYYDGSKYDSRKWYLDHTSANRNPANGFEALACNGYDLAGTAYQCKKTIGVSPGLSLPANLILIRARMLYNTNSQPFAVQASWPCSINPVINCYLPPQARSFTSVGSSGETQRTVKLFQQSKVIPPYFDYAIFSAGEIKK